MSSSSRRTVGLLVLVAVLLAPWAVAADPATRTDPAAGASRDLLARLWNVVSALWGDAGCSMDPFGHCGGTNSALPPAENLDNGCSMDPNGTCRNGSTLPPPTENLDNGCHIDPYGTCRPDR